MNVKDSYSKIKEKLFQKTPFQPFLSTQKILRKNLGCWINLPLEDQKNDLGKMVNSEGRKRGIRRRLSMSEPFLTLLCSPFQKQTEWCQPFEERPLIVREYAPIQTFRNDYHFYGSITSQYHQIGNAIPVSFNYQLGLYLSRKLSFLDILNICSKEF